MWGYTWILPLFQVQAGKSVGVHSFLPNFNIMGQRRVWGYSLSRMPTIIYIQLTKSAAVDSFLPTIFRQARVWGYTLSCLLYIQATKNAGYTLSYLGTHIPPHSLLPEYSRREREYPHTLRCPIIFKLGRVYPYTLSCLKNGGKVQVYPHTKFRLCLPPFNIGRKKEWPFLPIRMGMVIK